MKRAVFLDRDGVLIADRDYLADPKGVRVLKGVPEALVLLKKAGFTLVVVSNQSGVARGYFTEAAVRRVNAELSRRLKAKGARVDAVYFSPHAPDSKSPMRKPGTGMLLAAKRRFGLDLKASFLVGDKTSDIECARRAGCAGVLVRTGKGGKDREFKAKPAAVKPDLLAATRWILRNS